MKRLLPWAVILVIIWVAFGTIYAAVQQSQRSDANMPQIQIAEDAANSSKQNIVAYTLGDKVDMAKSLAPFINIYDKKGNVVYGSGYLDGKIPKPPIGILQDSNGQDYNAVTWQPKDDVRIAAVTTSSKDYYVLSGRSLTEVEKNENTTLIISLLGAVIVSCLLALVFVLSIVLRD